MPTVINNPPSTGRENNGSVAGAIVTGIVVIVLVILFFLYGLPRISGNGETDVNLPNQIEVNTDSNY